MKKTRRAFTLVELLVVIAIIGALVALLLPAIQSSRHAARRVECASKMRQLGLAVLNYYDRNKLFPKFGYSETGWTVRIMPFLDELGLNRDMKRVGHDESPASSLSVPAFQCSEHPSKTGQGIPSSFASYGVRGLTSYLAIPGKRLKERDLPLGDTGVMGGYVNNNKGVTLKMITDGTTKTALIGERPPGPGESCDWGWWSGRDEGDIILYPQMAQSDRPPSARTFTPAYANCTYPAVYREGRMDSGCDQDHLWSLHVGGANWTMCDSSVHFIPYSVDLDIIDAISTRDGGETFSVPW